MEEKKFGLLNIDKKQKVTHADIQKKTQSKKGGRPRKTHSEKLSSIVSINVNKDEKKTLEDQAKSMGITVLSLIRISLAQALRNKFKMNKNSQKRSTNSTSPSKNQKVIKQYAIPVTQEVKSQLEEYSLELMVSVSGLLKMALRNNG